MSFDAAVALSAGEGLPAHGQGQLHRRGYAVVPRLCGGRRDARTPHGEQIRLRRAAELREASLGRRAPRTRTHPHPGARRHLCRLFPAAADLQKRGLYPDGLYGLHAQPLPGVLLPQEHPRGSLRNPLLQPRGAGTPAARLRRDVPSRRGLSHSRASLLGGIQGPAARRIVGRHPRPHRGRHDRRGGRTLRDPPCRHGKGELHA